ncbi:hypothetical protein J437_LFUL003898 [Ladona fulva]|uniref:Uncharacterized protein n=1 Tax=Ladona fulva TaxID=123851 RepID=A0A8K0P285_LADFU|nr:hypothetical protein J437_LFUL003898 [Ladona fulva]
MGKLSRDNPAQCDGQSPILCHNHNLETVYKVLIPHLNMLSPTQVTVLFDPDTSSCHACYKHLKTDGWVQLADSSKIGEDGNIRLVHEQNLVYFYHLRKAFDRTDHEVLYKKLSSYGINGNSLHLIYPVLYADDTSFLITANNLPALVDNANLPVPQIQQWYKDKNLATNQNKTSYFITNDILANVASLLRKAIPSKLQHVPAWHASATIRLLASFTDTTGAILLTLQK